MAADADEEGGEFHLFGNLFLPDPRKHLTSDALEWLLQLKPFIRDLKNRQQGRRPLSTDFSPFKQPQNLN